MSEQLRVGNIPTHQRRPKKCCSLQFIALKRVGQIFDPLFLVVGF